MTKSFERLFFALWPSQVIRDQLIQRYQGFKDLHGRGRRLPDYNLHLTLHFLGNIDLERVDCFEKQARQVRARPFDLKLTRNGYFNRPKIVYLGMDSVPDGLVELHAQLGDVIQHCDFMPEQRSYNPHVTMARKILSAPRHDEIEPINWSVSDFVLVQSVPVEGGVKYRVKQRYILDG